MNPEEAAQVVSTIRPAVAIPIHWGRLVGSKEDARLFAEIVGEKAQILEPVWQKP